VNRHDGQAVTLTADEAALIRQALAACSGIFSRAMLAGGPGRRSLEEAALEVVADGRPLGQVRYDVSLAIDYLDFARPARSTR
jgi:hypothetical protein